MPNRLSVGLRFFWIMSVCRSWASGMEIFNVRAQPFLAVVGLIRVWSVSRSCTLRLHSSVGLMPVSRLSRSLRLSDFPAPAIKVFICSSVGSLGIFSGGL